MTKLLITAAVSFLAFGLATRSLAEPGPIGRWLMDQPRQPVGSGTVADARKGEGCDRVHVPKHEDQRVCCPAIRLGQ